MSSPSGLVKMSKPAFGSKSSSMPSSVMSPTVFSVPSLLAIVTNVFSSLSRPNCSVESAFGTWLV